MPNTVTTKKLTSAVQVREVTNAATVSVLASSGDFATLIDAVDVRVFDKVTIQVRNIDNTSTPKVRVFGTLFPNPGSTPTATNPADSAWVQIGDDIDIGASTGAIKSISTTALKQICVVIRDQGSNTQTFPAGDCVVFCQGTI
tara:strand:- start:3 stop:431 length:429 start_codon:yes stop_codon:yes gene_type:complete